MPEWLIERGIGETRYALVEDGDVIEARVRRDGVIPAGTILEAKLVAVAPRVTVEGEGETFLLPRGVSGVSEGRSLVVEVTREALGGAEPWKRGLARITNEPPRAAPPLAEGREAWIADWDDLLEDARSGIVAFEGGELRIEPTAAMTMIDVDGWLEPPQLAQVAAWAAARAIRRLDIGGSTGIDFPTLRSKRARHDVDRILEDYLPKPSERTAMNGFGFVQVVRPRRRASLVELAGDRAPFEARALLRRAASESPGSKRLVAHPAVIAVLEQHRPWLDALGRQVGGNIGLRPNPGLTMSGGYAEQA
ncbi:MAG: ribonuclease E/G [Sphingomonas sp.]|nr:ribonuclease E/G [Sphingomonas sp.]